MPFYSYRCEKCSHEFEEMRSISKMDDEIECPTCSSNSTRFFNAGSEVGVIFSGWGWSDKNSKFAKERMETSKKMGEAQKNNHQSLRSIKS
jgi:putative FmdB family regulatory protein